MGNQALSDFVDSIQLNEYEIDIEKPTLELRCGQRYKLKVFGRKDGPSFTGRCDLRCLNGDPPGVVEIISSHLSVPGGSVIELVLMTRDYVGKSRLELGVEGSQGALIVSVDVEADRIKNCRIRLENGDERAAGKGGRFIAVPVDEKNVVFTFEHESMGRRLVARDEWVQFEPDVIQYNPQESKVITGYPGNVPVYLQDGGGLYRGTIHFEIYKAWATFSSDGANHGEFLPIMMEANRVYKISVSPLDAEENGAIGVIYGIPEWMDVFPEQDAENFDGPHVPWLMIGAHVVYPIGGPGKSERYIRLKDTAPKGALPVIFAFLDGKESRGIVNLERI